MRRQNVLGFLLFFKQKGLVGWQKLDFGIKRVKITGPINTEPPHKAKRTYSNVGSNSPFLYSTVRSQHSIASTKILGPVLGFSCITPSQSEIPSCTEAFEKIRKGKETKQWITNGWSSLLLQSKAAARCSASLISRAEISSCAITRSYRRDSIFSTSSADSPNWACLWSMFRILD